MASKTYYEFPARGAKPPVRLTWYDGGMFPPTPPEFADGDVHFLYDNTSAADLEAMSTIAGGEFVQPPSGPD